MVWWYVACCGHKSKFLCQQPSFVCLSNRPSFFLKYSTLYYWVTKQQVESVMQQIQEEQMAIQQNIVGQLDCMNF